MILTSLDLESVGSTLPPQQNTHPYEYIHDEVAFNYRLPNLNAALGCAQLEQIENFVASKRALAKQYKSSSPDLQWSFSLSLKIADLTIG